ncbi:hypothetical protein BCD67_16010 [Oscillatoriales cyanobacterium USR001]|nr:hypothetical protein BCD67_16010 [Oscillatoriales cyanobacterium USR001]
MLGQTIFGRYEITKLLKDTNFCEIYLAKDRQLPNNDLRVVKRLKQSLPPPLTWDQGKHCLEIEAQILNDLEHDQIPQLFTRDGENQEFYLVQDYIDGRALSEEELAPGQRLNEKQVSRLLQEILEVVKFVHSKQIIHCDINPSNLIRRTPDLKMVLIDFGSAKQMGGQATNYLAVEPSIDGYTPKEQKSGHPNFNSDIYAVGMIGMQALTGVSAKEIPTDPNTSKVIWPIGIKPSAKLQDILDKMVEPNVRDRYQSADEVLQALTKLNLPHHTRFSLFIQRAMSGEPTAVAEFIFAVIIGLLGLIFAFPSFVTGIRELLYGKPNPETTVSPVKPNPEPTVLLVNPDNFKIYTNDKYGITIKHPTDWKPQEKGGINGEVVKFVHQPSQANVVVSVKTLSDWMSLEEYTKESVKNIENEFKIERRNGSATLAKRPAFQVVYTGKDENNNSLKMMEVWNLKDKKAYIITFEVKSGKYDEFSKIAEEMIDSFEVK